MPTVPVIDQTASSATPFAAGNVAPVRNAAPEQMAAVGQQLAQTGAFEQKTGATIGDRVAEQVDDAKTKQAETAALNSVQSTLYDPDNGYFRKLGQSAVDNYQPAKEEVVKSFQDQLGNLGNDIQKHMFTQVMNQHLLTIGQKMADYNHAQSVSWAATESKARADSLSLQALGAAPSRYQVDADGNRVGDFAKLTAQMETEVYKAAHNAGFEPDSAQAQAMIREQWSSLNHAMISQMLDNHDAYGAKSWMDEQLKSGNINERDAEQLGGVVKTEYDRQHDVDVRDQLISQSLSGGKNPVTLAMPIAGGSINVTAGLGEARAGGRSHDGIDIAVPVGTSVMAPAAGKVTKVWTDEKFGGGLSVEMELPNGMTAGFAHMSASNVRVGDQVQQGGQLGLSGKTGNATGPVLHYMMKDANGQYVDPRQVSQPQPDAASFADPNALKRSLDALNADDSIDSFNKKRIEQMLLAEHGHQKEVQDQQYQAQRSQVSDTYFKNGGYVPPSMLAGLKGEDQHKFSEPLARFNNEAVYQDYVLHPPANPVDWLQQHRVDFEQGTYISLLTKAQNDANGPDKERTASIDNEQMDDILNRNGFANLVTAKPGTPDAVNATALKVAIKDRYFSQQNIDGKPLTREQKADIITKAITDTVSQRTPWYRSDKTGMPAFEYGSGLPNATNAANAYVTVTTPGAGTQKVKLASIPQDDQRQITAALQRTGQPVTQQKIAEYWVRNKGKVPSF